MKNELYMPFFYDWIPTFEDLNPRDFKRLFLKMVKFHQNPTEIPKPRGSTKQAEGLLLPQLKRLITCRENGKKGGNPKLKKKEKSDESGLNPPSTLGSSTNTNTKTNTKTNTNTNPKTNTADEGRFDMPDENRTNLV